MFTQASPDHFKLSRPGITIKTLVYGDKTLMVEVHLEKGSQLPLHEHPQEQTGYLVSGLMRLTIAGEAHDVRPGGAWSIPGGVPHSADMLEECVAVEVFSPVREDYLKFYPANA